MEQKQEQIQEQQAQVVLTPEIVQDLLDLLPNPNPEVRHGTISAILQYTPTREHKLMFINSTLLTNLRKYLFEPKLTTICLSTLIHFASQSQLLPQYFNILEPLVLKMKEWKALQLQLSLLLLLNISKEQQIVVRLLGKQDKKGYLMEVLYALLQNNEKVRWIVVGIFVNASAIERGRNFLVDQGVAIRFLQYLNSFDQRLREAALKIVRNCAFEWENQSFSNQLLKSDHQLFTKLVRLLAFLIYRQGLIHDNTHTKLILRKLIDQGESNLWQNKFQISDKAKALNELQLGIDIMLILSNCELKQKKIELDPSIFKDLLGLLKFTDIKEETKDKLQALEIFGL